jgi:hypothetical protein
LTIDGVKEHGIIVNSNSDDLLVHNLRIVDAGAQFIKVNAAGSDRGTVEYSLFEYRTTDTDDNTNGVSVQGGDNWIVRYNLFRNILSPSGAGLSGPAVLIWNDSSDTVVEGNSFMNVARGVSLGLVDKTDGFDHQGGVIRNNFFYRSASLAQSVDVPIMVADSPNTSVLHNTVLNRGSYPNAIEYRFRSSRGLEIRNNLTDARITARDQARASASGNNTNAMLTWFVNPATGDLHLVPTAPAINKVSVLPGTTNDIDGENRSGQADIGADEYFANTITLVSASIGQTVDETEALLETPLPAIGTEAMLTDGAEAMLPESVGRSVSESDVLLPDDLSPSDDALPIDELASTVVDDDVSSQGAGAVSRRASDQFDELWSELSSWWRT